MFEEVPNWLGLILVIALICVPCVVAMSPDQDLDEAIEKEEHDAVLYRDLYS